ncbi:MAG TPA: adenine phosphoribosyltransferase [Vicinamibacteria bacterium]|nr:adenine phosphoribosyltransferase [Vicinamibacteria bacterium]
MDQDQTAVLRAAIRDVPDFPKPGIVFKDITPLLGDPAAFRLAMELMAEMCADLKVDQVVAIESRGFIFGGALADRIGAGFVPVRKPGKLPWRRVSRAYDLEYGTDAVEMHQDALRPGARALVVDDVIATGGTARAVSHLVEQLGAHVVGHAFLLELSFLQGRGRLAGYEVRSLIRF